MPAYLVVRVTLKWGSIGEYNKINAEFIPLIEQRRPIKLIGSYQAASGSHFTQEVLDIWEVPNPNDLWDGLSGTLHFPEWSEFNERLADVIVSEEVLIYAKTPFSP